MDTGRSVIIASALLVVGGGVAAYAVTPRYSLANPGGGISVRLDRRGGDMIACRDMACRALVEGSKIVPAEIVPAPPPGFKLDTAPTAGG
jgi:hypothetical protein